MCKNNNHHEPAYYGKRLGEPQLKQSQEAAFFLSMCAAVRYNNNKVNNRPEPEHDENWHPNCWW